MLHLSPDDFWRATPHEIAAAAETMFEIKVGAPADVAPGLGAADIDELKSMLRDARLASAT